MPRTAKKQQFYDAVQTYLGTLPETITRQQINEIVEKTGMKFPSWVTYTERRVGRGLYRLTDKAETTSKPAVESVVPVTNSAVPEASAELAAELVHQTGGTDSFVPNKMSGYVPFGHFSDVRSIVRSGKFYPTYITGLSGNGKTLMVEQVCAQEKREIIRVNITIETDEDDLIGGFRLVDGKTVWQNGPVVVAMERGAVLLLDEVDLGSNKLMCLQPVLEGNPIFIKKINRKVEPAPGFNIIATANTKGQGNDDGRFVGTNVMNEAFLDRFNITFEQEYPNEKIENKIINYVLESNGTPDTEFANDLVKWANVIRKSFYEDAVSEIISTRRLVNIAEAYGIFGKKREKAVELCLSRFDADTKAAFLDLYSKLDASEEQPDDEAARAMADDIRMDQEVPF